MNYKVCKSLKCNNMEKVLNKETQSLVLVSRG